MAAKKTLLDGGPIDSEQVTTIPQPTAVYEVLVKEVKIKGVIAYRTARVNLTKDEADALNTAQPDTVKFIGI